MLKEQFDATHTPFDLTKYADEPYEVNRVEILKQIIPLGQGEKALDIGCGPGFFSKELSARNWKTTSIDSDKDNIESARNFVYETFIGDAISVLAKFPENYYDLRVPLNIL